MKTGMLTYSGRAVALCMEPKTIPCPACKGRRWLTYEVYERDGSAWDRTYDCGHCRGNGWLWRDGTPGPRGMKRP